jgi:hypothetical protein
MISNAVITDIILDKRRSPRNTKVLEEFEARININFHVDADFNK